MKTYIKKSPNRKTLLNVIAECNRQEEEALQKYTVSCRNLAMIRGSALTMLSLKERCRKK